MVANNWIDYIQGVKLWLELDNLSCWASLFPIGGQKKTEVHLKLDSSCLLMKMYKFHKEAGMAEIPLSRILSESLKHEGDWIWIQERVWRQVSNRWQCWSKQRHFFLRCRYLSHLWISLQTVVQCTVLGQLHTQYILVREKKLALCIISGENWSQAKQWN